MSEQKEKTLIEKVLEKVYPFKVVVDRLKIGTRTPEGGEMKVLIENIAPLLNTRPMFGVFCLGDGSFWFCAGCGERVSKVNFEAGTALSQIDQATLQIKHKPDCVQQAHWRAIGALQDAVEKYVLSTR